MVFFIKMLSGPYKNLGHKPTKIVLSDIKYIELKRMKHAIVIIKSNDFSMTCNFGGLR